MANYFEILNLPVKFDIDLPELDKHYFSMQVKFHPDKADNEADKQIFLMMTAKINEAYEHLKDELKRAQAILSASNIDLDDEKIRSSIGQEFLQKIWADFEAVGDSNDCKSLSEMLANKYLQKRDVVESLKSSFADQDMQAATKLTIFLKYIDNLIEKIKQKLQSNIPK
jgi:molecular chaperone HscB